jgi:hypothetical protein
MYQPWVFAATLTAGSGLFAYSAIQHGVPPPDIAPAPQAVTIIPMPEPAPIAEPVSTVVEIEPIVIEAKRHARVATPAPAPKPKSVGQPCSDWRELGPAHVSSGKPSGSVSVRELCP